MAIRRVAIAKVYRFREFLFADVHRERAAGMERAAGRRVGRTWHITRQDDAFFDFPRVGHRNGRHQSLGVRMLWRFEQFFRIRHFDDFPEVHDRHFVGHVLDDAQIVRDEQVGQVELFLQVEQKIDDLRLHRDVERRYGFIGDDEVRLQDDRPRDSDALALSAREFMRITVKIGFGQSDDMENTQDFLEPLLFCEIAMDAEWLHQDLPDGLFRIQRGIRILKNHLQLAPQTAHIPVRQIQDVLAFIEHFAGRRFRQAENRAPRCRFAAARLADQSESLAFVDREADVIDSADDDFFLEHALRDFVVLL